MTDHTKSTLTLTSADNYVINVQAWLPDSEPEQVIVLSHGMAEHIDRYQPFAEICQQNNIAVYGANHRGHGSKATIKGFFAAQNGWQRITGDLDKIIDYASMRHRKPVCLIGHSMGSFLALHYSTLFGAKLSHLILCGSNKQPRLLLHAGRAVAWLQKMLHGPRHPSKLLEQLSFGQFNNTVKKPTTDFDWLSRDAHEVERYIQDPLCGFTCTTQFWLDFMGGLIAISHKNTLAAIPKKLPVLITSGDRDPVGQMGAGVQALYQSLQDCGMENLALKLYPEARHELFHETNRTGFYKDLIQWLGSTSHSLKKL